MSNVFLCEISSVFLRGKKILTTEFQRGKHRATQSKSLILIFLFYLLLTSDAIAIIT